MKATLRFLVVPLFALVAVACGNPQQVKSDVGSSGTGVSAAAAAATTTTTPAPTKAKTTALGDLDEVAGSDIAPSGTVKINGAVLDDSIYGWACGPSTLNFDLNRAYTTLTATAGVDDNSMATDSVTFTFTADGNQIGSSVVKLGTSAPVQLNVANVLRLGITIASTATACDSGIGFGTHFALGNAQLTPKG
jgi:NPCBM/NEW2 domain